MHRSLRGPFHFHRTMLQASVCLIKALQTEDCKCLKLSVPC